MTRAIAWAVGTVAAPLGVLVAYLLIGDAPLRWEFLVLLWRFILVMVAGFTISALRASRR